jgi:hypothetical protein
MIIVGIAASVAIPNLATVDPYKLERVAGEVAEAIRFARGEALRSGSPHGVLIDHLDQDSSGKEIMVYKIDLAGSPFGKASTLHHPFTRQRYDLQVSNGPRLAGAAIANANPPFQFRNLAGNKRDLHFLGNGTAVYIEDNVPHLLVNGDILIANAQQQRTVSIQPLTGRVIVQ